MRYALLDNPRGPLGLEAALGTEGSWAEIGDRLIVWSATDRWPAVAKAIRSLGEIVAVPTADKASGELFLVTQVGDAFQREYRDIPVVLDRGRHLVIALTSTARRRLGEGDGICWELRPLPRNQTIVEVIDRKTASREASPRIQALVTAVSGPAMLATILHLTTLSTRHSLSTQFTEAAAWARDQLDQLGYEVEVRAFPMPGGVSANVIADSVPRDSTAGRALILVTAHLDSINIPGGPSARAPGADDNGSGAAGLLEMARVLSASASRHDLRFVLFGGEEEGLLGSKQYVDGMADTERSRIRAVINMDMIAVANTAKPAVLLEGASISSGQIADLSAAASTYTSLTVTTSLNPFASDHVPFINAEIPAVLTIEGADSANTAIHTANDTSDRLDLDLATEIVRMNVAATAALLGDEADWLAPVLHVIMT
jgi:Peptidase family M28